MSVRQIQTELSAVISELSSVPPTISAENVSTAVLVFAQALAPEQHFVTAPTSTLCKVVAWHASGVLRKVGHDPL
jgi:hypothetical protein